MKKQYVPAEVEILVLTTADILAVSNTDAEYDPEKDGKHDSAGWT